jgi:hypothetical protein
MKKTLQVHRYYASGLMKIYMYVKKLRRLYQRKRNTTKVSKKEERGAQKFSQYFDWSEPLTKRHRIDY